METCDSKVIDLYSRQLSNKRKSSTMNKHNANYLLKNETIVISRKMELLRQIESLVVDLKIEVENEESEKEVLITEKMDIIHSKAEILKEEYDMKLIKLQKLNKIHTEFIVTSFSTIIISLIGLLVFSATGFYFIHPTIYILGIFMGIGWGTTVVTSIYFSRRKNGE